MISCSPGIVLTAFSFGVLLGVSLLLNQGQPEGYAAHVPPRTGEGHGAHGTPEGWKLSWPEGDPVKGRQVFARLECHSCHAGTARLRCRRTTIR